MQYLLLIWLDSCHRKDSHSSFSLSQVSDLGAEADPQFQSDTYARYRIDSFGINMKIHV